MNCGPLVSIVFISAVNRRVASCRSQATVSPVCTDRDAGGGDAGEIEMLDLWGKISLAPVEIANINLENEG